MSTEKNQNNKKDGDNMPVKKGQKTVADAVLQRVGAMANSGEIQLPKNYSAQNAIKSAYLVLTDTLDKNKNPVLESCTQPSIINALLKMVIQGLSPDKNQCSFIPYGDKLTLIREYQGTVALAKRFAGLKMAYANVIYEGDEFAYKVDPDSGLKSIVKHEQAFENIDINKIKGAYAVLHFRDESKYVEVMTMSQIKQSWMQGDAKGNSPAHNKFPDEMAKKTVISRACKPFVNSSLDVDDEDRGATYLDPELEVHDYDDDTETLSLQNGRQEQNKEKDPDTDQDKDEPYGREEYDRMIELIKLMPEEQQNKASNEINPVNTKEQARRLISTFEDRLQNNPAAKRKPEQVKAEGPGF